MFRQLPEVTNVVSFPEAEEIEQQFRHGARNIVLTTALGHVAEYVVYPFVVPKNPTILLEVPSQTFPVRRISDFGSNKIKRYRRTGKATSCFRQLCDYTV